MTDTAEHPTSPTLTADPPPPPPVTRDHPHREPNRLYQVLAWVGIVAGVVFVVAVVFFSGFFLGKHSGGGSGHPDRHMHGVHVFHRGGPPPPMGPRGPGTEIGPRLPAGPPAFPPGSPTTQPSPPPRPS